MSDRFVRFLKFANGFAASLQRMPKPHVTEPGPGDLYRLPDGRARSERTPEEREALMREVRARVSNARDAAETYTESLVSRLRASRGA